MTFENEAILIARVAEIIRRDRATFWNDRQRIAEAQFEIWKAEKKHGETNERFIVGQAVEAAKAKYAAWNLICIGNTMAGINSICEAPGCYGRFYKSAAAVPANSTGGEK